MVETALTRILVTGAGGFAGRPTVAALDRAGATVIDARAGGPCDLLKADDRAALIARTRPDLLIHLAWETTHGAFWQSPLNQAWQDASLDLFARFFAAGGRRAVGIGTCAEYDWTTGAGRLAEDAPLAPHTPYGAAKARTGEALLDLATRQGVEAAWARVFFLFGPGEPPARLIPAMIRAVRDAEALSCGPGATRRDFWPIGNLGAALAALALSTLTGAINLASGAATRFDAVGSRIEAHFGARDVLRFGERPLGPGEPAVLTADTGRLRGALGFVDPVPLEAGLAAYCEAMA
ncbi:MAG: NAD-dependent epimerase/dehydratase family protein [Pseudomonadota bacterium]